VAYDQRGHALSERAASGDYSITALGRDLAAVLDALVPGPAIVVGHSLGGMSILAYTREDPDRAAKRMAGAVFLDTTGSDVLAGAFASTGGAAFSALQRLALERGGRFLRRRGTVDLSEPPPLDLATLITRTVGFGPDASPAQVAFVEQMTVDTANTVKADLGPTLTATDLRDAPPQLRVPALVLVGEHDRLTPPAAASRLADALPDAGLVVLPGAGHNAMLEAATEVTSELRAFARRHLAGTA
jgi:pimeloyl-ACP methyl ester carboxylesterase